MRKKMITMLLAGVTALVMLVGCGDKAEKTGTTPTPTVEATATVAPTEEPTVAPTETPAPTEEPTVTPTETPAVTDDYAETKVTLGQYKGLTLYEVDSSVVAEELQALVETYVALVAVDRAAEEGDTVNINYVGKKDGVAFDGGTDDSEEGYDLVLGSGTFIDGFEEGLIGAVAGEVRDLNLTFPENYGSEELAGQEVVFTVTVNAVKALPELTDAVTYEYFGYETTAELITVLYAKLNKESYYSQITESIMASSTVENYPADALAIEKQNIMDEYTYYAQFYGSYYGLDTETALRYFYGFASTAAMEAVAEESAYEVVKNLLILGEIYTVENLEPTKEEYQEIVLMYADSYGYEDAGTFIADYEAVYGADSVREAIMLDMVMDYIISQAIIVEAETDAEMPQ